MSLRVFVAGATGVVGRTLLLRLRERGHHVTALVRQQCGAEQLDGADDIAVGDLLEAQGLKQVLVDASPDVVVHVASGFADNDFDRALERTARLRAEGTRHLVDAAVEAGVGRVVAQSSAVAYSPDGHEVLDEEAPLWTDAPGRWGELVRATAELEEAALTRPEVEGMVLRYGVLYGPGTWFASGGSVHRQVCGSELPLIDDGAGLTSFTHVDDAASAVLEVLSGGDPAAYNVVDNEPSECTEWLPAYARMAGAPAPVSLTLEQARNQLDWFTVHQLTEQRGASNFRIRETLGWRPAWPSWREGFAALFGLWPS